MKNRILSIVIGAIASVALFSSTVEADEPFYGKKIIIPKNASDSLRESAAELARWLGDATSVSFEILSEPAENAIVLRSSGPADAQLRERGSEAFRITGTANEPLTVTGNSDAGIRHGVYFYLGKLGFRWLFPHDHWTIVPECRSIRLEIDRVEEPIFRLRNFFGTGGFGGKLPVDPDMELQARWELWKQRNRLGGDIQLSGHAGEAFNLTHRETLEAHPEYLAEIDGKRQPLEHITKPCYSNPGFRKLYVEDRLAKMKQAIERFPDSPRSMAVSVEPADGGDHCECAECLKLGSISDRVFSVANEVGKALAKVHPGKFANLYAYNEHAAPPQFSVEPNVFVLVAPYAFQRTGLPGEELLKAWSPRADHLGVYDYWAIPDWANCLPVFSFSRTTPEKIRFWHEQGVSAFLGESSYSAGNVGLVWYLASRLLWDPDANESAVTDEFFDLAFGPAREPMRRMLDRWDRDFLLSEHELALSFRDLAEALKDAVGDPAAKARVEDYGIYAQYLRLWREYDDAERGSEEKIDRAQKLIRFLWRIYPTAMVHSYRMFQLVALRYERGNESLLSTWPLKDAEAPAWKDLPPVEGAEVEKFIAAGIADFTPLDFDDRKYSEGLRPLTVPDTLSEDRVQSPQFTGTHAFEFFAPEGVPEISIEIRCGLRENYPGNLMLVTGPDGAEVFRHLAPSDGEWHEIAIPAASSGIYRMTVSDQKIFFAFKVPANLPFVVRDWKGCPALPSKVWFQVPKGLRRLAVSSESVVPLKISDADGNEIEHPDRKLFVVEIPEGRDGEIWSVGNFKSYRPLKLLNAPNVFAFSPEGVMIPDPPK